MLRHIFLFISFLALSLYADLFELDTKEIYFPTSDISKSKVGTITHDKLLTCAPNIDGFFYYTKKNVVLLVNGRLMANTRYSCSTNPRFLKKQTWTLSTSPLEVTKAIIIGPKEIFIEFNDELSKKEIVSSLNLYSTKNLSKSSVSFEVQSLQKRKFIIEIKEKVNTKTLSLSFKHKNMNKEYTKNFANLAPKFEKNPKRKSMVIYDNPRSRSMDDGKMGIELFFKGSFWGKDIKKYVQIDGVKDFYVTSPRYYGSYEKKEKNLHTQTTQSLTVVGDFVSGKTYKVKLLKGLEDSYTYQLRNDKSFNVTIGDRKPFANFCDKKQYLSSKGQIAIKSANLQDAIISVSKVEDFNYRYFVNIQSAQDASRLATKTPIYGKKITFSPTKNKIKNYKISLDTKKLGSGAYLVNIRNAKHNSKNSFFYQKLVFYSDISIVAKASKKNVFVSLSRLSNTSEISDATIEVYSDKNELIGSGETDSDGTAKISLKKDTIPKAVIAKHKDDQNFLILSSPLNNACAHCSSNLKNYSSFVFLPTKLIRPGNTLKSLIFIKDDKLLSKKLPIRVEIINPVYTKIDEYTTKTNEAGLARLEIPTYNSYKTGNYTMRVIFGDQVIGKKFFKIEDFVPEKIKNTIEIAQKKLDLNSHLELKLSSKYLFGAPASNLKTEIKITAVPSAYKNKDYQDYNFKNYLLEEKKNILYINKTYTSNLDEKGKIQLTHPIKLNEEPVGIIDGQVGFSVFDDGRAVSKYDNFKIYPFKRMIGVNLENKNLEPNEKLTIKTVALDPITNKIAKNVKLYASVKKIKWDYYYDNAGYFKWTKEFEVVDGFSFTSGKPTTRTYASSGDYVIEINDYKGGHSTSMEFNVRGWNYNAIAPTSELEKVQVKFDNKTYKKGDTLKVDMKTSIKKGRALITLEQEDVKWHKVYYFKNSTLSLDLPIDFDVKNGFYLTSVIVRDTAVASNTMPFRAMSFNFIKPNKEEKRIKMDLALPKSAKSSQQITASIKAKKNTYLMVSAVDMGILQITNQAPANVFKAFLKRPPQSIETYDFYNDIINHLAKGTMLFFGSGDMVAKAFMANERKHLAPKIADRVKPYVIASKLIKTNSSGNASFSFAAPDFNTNIRVSVVGASQDGVGSTHKNIDVIDDISIKPTYPRFLSQGDNLEIPVRIFNNTDKTRSVSLSVKTSKNIVAKITSSAKIPPKSSSSVHVTIKTLDLGAGNIKIIAKDKSDSFLHSLDIPILSPYPLQTFVINKDISDKTSMGIDKRFIGGKFNISISNDFLSSLSADLDYLIDYPYGCAEQTSSRLLALHYSEPFIALKEPKEQQAFRNDRQGFIYEGITKLAAMQNNNGSFSYWTRGKYINEYASIFASDVVLNLANKGHNIGSNIKQKIFSYLRGVAKKRGTNALYAAFILSNYNSLDTSSINYFYDNGTHENSLSKSYMLAAILKNANMTNEMTRVLSQIEKININALSNKRRYSDDFYSRTKEIATALYVHARFFKKNALSSRLLAALKSELTNMYSTHDKSLALRALVEYYKDMNPGKLKYSVEYNDKEKTLHKSTFIQGILKDNVITVDPSTTLNVTINAYKHLSLDPNDKQETKKKEKGLLGKLTNMFGSKDVEIEKQKKYDAFEGIISLKKDIVDENGKTISSDNIKVGDLVYSHITITSSQDLQNTIIADKLASCFEIVNERLLPNFKRPKAVHNSFNLKIDHNEIRDSQGLFFANLKERKTYEIFTPIRAVTKGKCVLPASLAEAMYDNRIKAYANDIKSINVKEGKTQKSKNPLKQSW